MDLDTLSKLGEFVGGFFVIISLVYLAYQVRQNTRSLRAENYARILEQMSTLQSRISIDPEMNRVFTVGAEQPSRLSRSERIRFSWALYELFGNGEFMYHQHRENTLPAAVWARWEATLGWWISHPGMCAWWRAKPTPFAADFTAFVDDLMSNNRFDAAAIARWREFVAGDGLLQPTEKAAETKDGAP